VKDRRSSLLSIGAVLSHRAERMINKSSYSIALIVSLTHEEATQSDSGKYQSTDISIVILIIDVEMAAWVPSRWSRNRV
jgi:hypothetical protein